MKLEKSEKSKKVIYKDVVYLSNLFNILDITKIDKSLRPNFLQIKKDIDLAAEEFIEHKTFILIMEGGVQNKNQDGSKSYDEPPFVDRKECTDDDEFKYKNEKVKTTRKKIKVEIFKLLETESNCTIIPFMSEEEFNIVHDYIKSVDFESIRKYFIK